MLPESECPYFKAKGMHLFVGSKHGDVCHGCGLAGKEKTMAAELTEETTYSWYCADCGEGGPDYPGDECGAAAGMEAHNGSQH